MNKRYSRRDVLRIGAQAGLAFGPLGLIGCNSSSAVDGSLLPPLTPPPSGGDPLSGYKALVCIFLRGGNDSYNTVVPTTHEKYATYETTRGGLAVPKSELLGLNAVAGDGARYGLNPHCAELADLFNSGRAAIASNVGSLLAPTTRADFQAGRSMPARLFSHNDQQDQWATAIAQGNGVDGWAGRIADVMANANPGALLPVNLSVAGASLYQTGHQTSAITVNYRGPAHLNNLGAAMPLRQAYDRIQGLAHAHAFEREYAGGHKRGLDMHAQLESALASATPLQTTFPDSNLLGAQLEMVARIIAVRGALSMRRQIFFVELSSFDTHDAQSTRHPQLLQRLSQAMGAFHAATEELGVAANVTTFTISDFGRSLSVNGKGTDHGWSGHHFAVGGAVRGGAFYGAMPSLVMGSDDDTRGGRFIPSTSVDEYAASFARWFGVADSNLDYVLPNLDRFPTRGLPLFG